MPILQFRDVSKHYGNGRAPVKALQDISLAAEAGEFVTVVGRSGCGKSTLLNLAGAMDFPTSGSVRINGTETSKLDDAGLTRVRRSEVGFVFQFFQLLPTLSAVENVELPLMLAGQSDVRDRAIERLRWVEMAELAGRYPHQLSGGQLQRVAIARALVQDPKILLADEPTGNLDSKTGRVVIDLLRRVAAELKTTVVMATHSTESLEEFDAVVRLRDGRIREIVRR